MNKFNSLAMTSLRVRLSVIYAMGDQTDVIHSPFNSSDSSSQVKYYHTVKTKFDEHFVVHRRFLERAKFSRRRQEDDCCTQSPNTVIWRGAHVARLNFKTSRVGVYKCFMSLSQNERKFFVFVGSLEKGDSDAL